jgi:hypothetical protein
MRLTAIMAHPEDAEIWAGGTICKHVASSISVPLSSTAQDARVSWCMGASIGSRKRFVNPRV